MKSWISGNSRNTFFRIRSLMVSRSSGSFQLRTGDAPGFLPWSSFGHFQNFQRTPFSGSVCLLGQNASIALNCLTLARKYKEVRVSQYCVPWVLHNICNHCNGWPRTAAGGSFLGGGCEEVTWAPGKTAATTCNRSFRPIRDQGWWGWWGFWPIRGRQPSTDFPVIISCIISNHSALPSDTLVCN